MMAQGIVWTPAASKGEGSVILKSIPLRLTKKAYEGLLITRVTAMLEAARQDPEDPEALTELADLMEQTQGVRLPMSSPEKAAELMVMEADAYRQLTGMDAMDWPIKRAALSADPEMTPEDQREYETQPGVIRDLMGRLRG